MTEDDASSPQAAEVNVSPEELTKLEESRRLLFEDGYLPDWLAEQWYPEGLEEAKKTRIPGWKPIDDGERVGYAMNNFLARYLQRQNTPNDPMMTDIDQLANELQIPAFDMEKEVETAQAKGENRDQVALRLAKLIYPVFEKLVKERGYTVKDLKS